MNTGKAKQPIEINGRCPFCNSSLLMYESKIRCTLQGSDDKSCTFELNITKRIPPGPPEPPRPEGDHPVA